MAAQFCAYTETHCIVHSKRVIFMVCEFISQKNCYLKKQIGYYYVGDLQKTVLKFNNLLEGPTGPRGFYTQGYSLLQWKDTEQNQQREKAHGTKSWGNQAHMDSLNGVAQVALNSSSNDMCEVLPTWKAHMSLNVKGLYWRSVMQAYSTCMTSLSHWSLDP